MFFPILPFGSIKYKQAFIREMMPRLCCNHYIVIDVTFKYNKLQLFNTIKCEKWKQHLTLSLLVLLVGYELHYYIVFSFYSFQFKWSMRSRSYSQIWSCIRKNLKCETGWKKDEHFCQFKVQVHDLSRAVIQSIQYYSPVAQWV